MIRNELIMSAFRVIFIKSKIEGKKQKDIAVEMNISLKTVENQIFIGGIGMQEVLLIVLVVLLFFGGKKIPELMKGIGKGVRSFKEGMNNVEKEIDEIKDIEQKG